MRYFILAPDVAQALNGGEFDFVITGATGWLGVATTELLVAALGPRFDEHVTLFGASNQKLALSRGATATVYNLREISNRRRVRPTIFFHFAFLTKDKITGMPVSVYETQNRAIANIVIDELRRSEVAGLLLASSGAVYDYLADKQRDLDANLYGRLKLENEQRFTDACGTRGVRLIVPRIFNLSGPFMNKLNSYVLSSIIVNVLRGGPVRIFSDRPVFRSYFFIGDLIELCLRWFFARTSEHRFGFDTTGDETIEVGDLAHRVCQVVGAEGCMIERPQMLATGVEDRYIGDGTVLERMLSDFHYRLLDLNGQIAMTARYITEKLRDGGACEDLNYRAIGASTSVLEQ